MSAVWDFFTKLDDKRKVRCHLCEIELSYTAGSTSSLRRHAERRHSEEFENATKKRKCSPSSSATSTTTSTTQPTLSAFISTKSHLSKDSPKAQKLTKWLIKMLTVDMQPMSIVEDKGFRGFAQECEPRFVLPSRSTIRNKLLPEAYKTTALNLKKMFMQEREKNKAFAVNITTDAWTSRATTSYVTYTIHFVTTEFEMKNYVLSTTEFRESHTSQHLQKHLLEMLRNWGLFDRRETTATEPGPVLVEADDTDTAVGGLDINLPGEDDFDFIGEGDWEDEEDRVEDEAGSASIPEGVMINITTDNASNVSKAVKDTGFNHIRCFAHTLNLSVQKGLKVVDSQLAKLRRLVSVFHRSATANTALEDRLKGEGKANHKLIIDVKTRWNSTYDMVERYLKLHTDIYTVLSKLKMNDLVRIHNSIDMEVSEQLALLLKPFKDVTNIMSIESSSSISLIRPLIHQLMELCQPVVDVDTAMIRQVKATILHDLETRYNTGTDILDICTFLDPRVKSSPYLSASEKARVQDSVFQLMSKHCHTESDHTFAKVTASTASNANPDPTPSALAQILGNQYSAENSLIKDEELFYFELKKYVQEPACSMSQSLLDW